MIYRHAIRAKAREPMRVSVMIEFLLKEIYGELPTKPVNEILFAEISA